MIMRERENLTNYKGVVESTLREGQQFARANFTLEQECRIMKMLTILGVERIEVGNPMGVQTRSHITGLVQVEDRPPLLAHVRSRVSDIQAAIDIGVDGVNILCVVDRERLEKMGLTLEEHITQMRQGVLLAKERGLETRVSVEHYFNDGHHNPAMRVYREADGLGVNRIGVADTISVARPRVVAERIAAIRREVKADIEVHFHNGEGHATSNAEQALVSGANWVDTTVLGIGERTGITPLSTFLTNLYALDPDITGRYQLELLTPLDRLVAGILDMEVPFNLPTAENAFNHKAGIHIDGVRSLGPGLYEERTRPGVIGNRRGVVLRSAVSGRTTEEQMERFFEEHGLG